MNLTIPSFLSVESSRILSQLAKAYGFNLSNFQQDIYLRLELEGYNRLVLERHEPQVISLSHYFVQNGDLMSNPDVTFFVCSVPNSSDLLIYPLSITQSVFNIYREVAFLDHGCLSLKSFKAFEMKDLADFCNIWATNIKQQQWFLPDGLPNPNVRSTAS